MRAGRRLGVAIWAAGLGLAPAQLAAQVAPDAPASTPATDAVGPRELQNFSLSGTVTRPADQPPPRTTNVSAAQSPSAPDAVVSAPAAIRQTARTNADSAPTLRTASSEPERPVAPAPEALRQTPPASSVTVALPSPGSSAASSPPPLKAATDLAADSESAAGTLTAEHGLSLWPWLLAAIALGAGGAFLFWRNRPRDAFAGGPQIDAFVAPEPTRAPAPRPRAPESVPTPVPPRAAAPVPQGANPPVASGVVSTRLRPWLEVAMVPMRCIVEETQVVFEFELDLFNSGNAPARAVLVEASVFNAGPAQDQEIGAFFTRPGGEGERIDSIPPLQRMTLRTQVVAPIGNVQVLDVAGRQVFVPLIAFNALYRWSAADGQTSVSYLLGRDTKGEKMAPFRLDLGPRVFRGVGARQLPAAVRQ
jgi:hypothetical protein